MIFSPLISPLIPFFAAAALQGPARLPVLWPEIPVRTPLGPDVKLAAKPAPAVAVAPPAAKAVEAVPVAVAAAKPVPKLKPPTSTPIIPAPVAVPVEASTAQRRSLAGASLYAPTSPAAAAALHAADPADAAALQRLATLPTAIWLTGTGLDAGVVSHAVGSAAGTAPVFVLYGIPNRDCGSWSAGGLATDTAYRAWVRGLASAAGSKPAAFIIEPDALAQITCLDLPAQFARAALLADAVAVLGSQPGAYVYLDASHAGWIPAEEMSNRLKWAGIAGASGFSLNVSNFGTTSGNAAYGRALSALVGDKGFLIDTGRNGNGPAAGADGWCNPSGRAVGALPTTATGDPLVDAYLWVKVPGESDGRCNGGPSAGTFWPEYAVALSR